MKRAKQDVPAWANTLFATQNALIYDLQVPFTRETWHGRIKACRGIGASSLPDETIAAFEQEHMQMLRELPEAFTILHYVSILDFIKKDTGFAYPNN